MMENKERIPGKEELGEVKDYLKPVDRDIPISGEIKTWLRKVEEAGTVPSLNQDDLAMPKPQLIIEKKKTELPVSQRQFLVGLGKKFSEASKWLTTFVLRLIKMKGGNVQFKKE
jgi:Tfp pilus assembly protein PilO